MADGYSIISNGHTAEMVALLSIALTATISNFEVFRKKPSSFPPILLIALILFGLIFILFYVSSIFMVIEDSKWNKEMTYILFGFNFAWWIVKLVYALAPILIKPKEYTQQ